MTALSPATAAMHAYADGDDAAFAVLYEELAPRLLAYAERKLRSRDAAEDVVQQTFLNMHRARGRFTAGAKVEPWAYAIARRLVIDRVRGNRSTVPVGDIDEAAGAVDPTGSPESVALAREVERVLLDELDGLAPRMRDAFVLVRIEEHSSREAALLLDTTADAAKLRAHRVAARLRARLASLLVREA